MVPKSDPCKVCLCKEGWKGQLNDKVIDLFFDANMRGSHD